MRAMTVGMEFATADGTVVDRMAGLAKDNAGYDLSSLIIGSEGTLAIITRVLLRLTPRLPFRASALFAFRSLDDALDAFLHLRRQLRSLIAADFFLDDGLRLVCSSRHLPIPFGEIFPAYLIIELADNQDPTLALAETAGDLPGVIDIAVAADGAGRTALWAYRELHNEVANALGVPHKADVGLRLADVPAFVSQVLPIVRAVHTDADVMVYGHLGDGNVHVSVIGPPPEDPTIDEAIYQLVGRFGGTISAEHGVGIAKRPYLGLSRSSEEIDLMRLAKRAFDPQGLLNPGCLLSGGPLTAAQLVS
jgi:FAD/FMN-containing dehydrogenase